MHTGQFSQTNAFPNHYTKFLLGGAQLRWCCASRQFLFIWVDMISCKTKHRGVPPSLPWPSCGHFWQTIEVVTNTGEVKRVTAVACVQVTRADGRIWVQLGKMKDDKVPFAVSYTHLRAHETEADL
eukprot:6255483-Amphidinium_carterae.1